MAARETSDPLKAIDWGTAVRNPDVGVYFAPNGPFFDDWTYGWSHHERQQAMLALRQYAEVADVRFHRTGWFNDAEFVLTIRDLSYLDTPGMMNPPGEQLAGVATFDDDAKFTSIPLWQGSSAFALLLHEFGHGLGLAHPHDDGGTSPILRGVTAEMGSFGIGELNQGVYTVMSYNEGWPGGPNGAPTTNAFGHPATPMALDIALLQEKYGPNLSHATGDDVYELPDANRKGTYYSCIWDAGGNDWIVHDGASDSVIDLRAATLKGEIGGGGWLSHVWGIEGGFTIAHGVVIENAAGGSGYDMLRGNGADNVLAGRSGPDLLVGRGGADELIGGRGSDTLRGGRGDDLMTGGRGSDMFDLAAGCGDDRITDFLPGTDFIFIRSGAESLGDLTLTRLQRDTVVDFADVRLTLEGLRPAQLAAEDFLFA